MKKYFAIVAIVVAVIAASFLWPEPDKTVPPSSVSMPAPKLTATSTPIPATPPRVASEPPPALSATPVPAKPNPRTAGSRLARELNAPNSDAARDVAALHEMLRQYLRLLRQRPGHPIGNDSDLARVFKGQNPMKLVFLPPSHPALSPDGRLLDRWGTPYFIHPRGQGAFEVRSAGPDRKLFTPDDAIENAPQGRTESVEAAELGDVPDPD